jgi:hypothetical protein
MSTKLQDLQVVSLPAAEVLLAKLLTEAAVINDLSTKKARVDVQKVCGAMMRAKGGIVVALDEVAGKVSKLVANVQARKVRLFPNAAAPAPATPEFDSAHAALMLQITALRAALLDFDTRDVYVRYVPAPAPARARSGGGNSADVANAAAVDGGGLEPSGVVAAAGDGGGVRGRGGGRGSRGRGGDRGRGEGENVQPVAADALSTDASVAEREGDAALIALHAQRMQDLLQLRAQGIARDARRAEQHRELDDIDAEP